MLLICLLGTIVVLLIFLIWYLKEYHKEWWFWNDAYVVALTVITALVWISMCITAVVIQSGFEDTDLTKLLNSRHRIIAEINSKDPAIHNLGIDDAVAYNQEIKYYKGQLDSLWSNWFTSKLWADAEPIEVDTDSYIIIPETKE